MRILVAIANFGTKNTRFLERILDEYRSMPWSIDLVVHSDIPKELGADVEVIVGLPTPDPRSLPYAHKTLFSERRGDYDLYIYSEDDTLITRRNVEYFLACDALLPEGSVPGFLRYEDAPDGTRYYSTIHSHYHWEVDSLEQAGGHCFARFTNDHAASFILTRAQLARVLDTGRFLQGPRAGAYGILETAATDPFTQCGLRRMICLTRIEDAFLHHMPDLYLGKLGVERAIGDLQIATLLRLAESGARPRPLMRTETKLEEADWDKMHYEPRRDDILSRVPRSAKSLLSIGCGWGVTEAAIQERGVEVAVVPLDEVAGETARSRGLEALPADIDAARAALSGRRFDAILFSDVLHLAPDPLQLLRAFFPSLAPEGTLLVSLPNFRQPRSLARRLRRDCAPGDRGEGSVFERCGLHPLCEGRLRRLLGTLELRVTGRVREVSGKRRWASRATLGWSDAWLAPRVVLEARRARPGRDADQKRCSRSSQALSPEPMAQTPTSPQERREVLESRQSTCH